MMMRRQWWNLQVLLAPCLLAQAAAAIGDPSYTSSPVIGVLSQPYLYRNATEYWIPASYVKWLESAGARAIPIPYQASSDVVRDLFQQVNGVLFPGGGSNVPDSAKLIWKLALQANKEGDFFPIWGTCLGFEYMVQLASSSNNTLQSGFDAENISLPLIMWPLSENKTRIYADPSIHCIASTQNVAMNNHQQGVEPEQYLRDSGLTEMFNLTAVNRDKKGRSFVSTMEPREPDLYPFYGVQFHPEKNAFEYGTLPGTNRPYENINHSKDAIRFSLHLAQFFVDLTRQNSLKSQRHGYTKSAEYPLVYSYEMKRGTKFEQVYVIPDNNKNHSESLGIDESSSFLRKS